MKGIAIAIAAAAVLVIQAEPVAVDRPPRRIRLSRDNGHICKLIGIRFNGGIRPGDVIAYDMDEGWIETNRGKVLRGNVEPFWRPVEQRPPEPPSIDRQAEAISAADAKRARKAAKRLAAS